MTETNKRPEQQVVSKSSAEADVQSPVSEDIEFEVLNREQLKIIEWLKKVKFQKQFIDGVKEQDVWKKIHQLNEMYEATLRAERIRYDVLLELQRKRCEPISPTDETTKESSVYE